MTMVFFARSGLTLCVAASMAIASSDVFSMDTAQTTASLTVVAAGPPYGCGVGGTPPNGNRGCPPVPATNNPRKGVIERLESEPTAHIRLAIRRCVNEMREFGWRERYETCYYQ